MPPRKHGTSEESRAAMMGLCMTMKGPNICKLEAKQSEVSTKENVAAAGKKCSMMISEIEVTKSLT